MSGKQVVFYEISGELLSVITRLSEKLYESGEKALLLLGDEDKLKEADMKLWTYSKLSFIPHGSRFSVSLDKADMCAIWLSTQIEFSNNPTVLIHDGSNDEIKSSMENFIKIIDISNSTKPLIKDRSEMYKKMGFLQQKLWIQEGNTWKSGDINT